MTILVPLVLFSWIFVSIILFFKLKPHRAVLVSIIGGILFLPVAEYNFPGLPAFTKNSVVAIGLVLGGWLSGHRRSANFHWSRYDIPILIWSICPIATSLANGLGWYDGLSGAWSNISTWGIPYIAGRIYFDSMSELHDLCLALLIGGLIYLPLCLYEIRMSPQLSNILYGFFPSDFVEHIRYGKFRPIVFMQHGLMVSLWMAATTTVAFWFWRSKEIRHIKGLPMVFVVIALAITTILCKSANGWTALILGCGSYYIYRSVKSPWPFRLILLFVPCYMLLRVLGGVSGTEIESMANYIFDAERVDSLAVRLYQEDIFIERTLGQPLLGWGGWGRGWPVDPNTGTTIGSAIDALWLIIFNQRGILGLVSFYAQMSLAPWLVLKSSLKDSFLTPFQMLVPVILSIIVILFLIDCLVNGMVNSIYFLISGALLGWYSKQKRNF